MMSIDPAEIITTADLAEGFNALRGSRPYAQLTAAAKKLHQRDGRQPALPRSTLSDLVNGKSVPTKDTVITFLTVCGLTTEQEWQPWLDAWDRVAAAHLRHPSGAVRVRQARSRLLGVHAAIRVDDGADEMPMYVPRDLDPGLRAAICAAGGHGGFVLLVGGSSVGKSRTLFEAVGETLPEWWLLHPADSDAIRVFAAAPTPRTVLWLDEFQHYLDRPTGLPAGTVRDLINAGTVLVATLQRREYGDRITSPEPGQPDPYANDRQLLGLAHVIDVPDAFSGAELDRAGDFAGEDARIRVAVDTPDAGVPQVLSGGPQLVEQWNNADAYARAVLTVAVDAARLGVHSPLPGRLLQEAAPGYCTDSERAHAPPGWFEQAVAYASRLRLGAVAPFAPVADGMAMGVTVGYRLAAYLLQHAEPERARHCPPATFWEACLAHLGNPGDLERLGHAADTRMRYRYAIPLLRCADPRDGYLKERLGWLLFDQGNFDEAVSIFRTLAETDRLMQCRLPGIEAELGQARVQHNSDIPSAAGEARMLRGLAGSRGLRRQLAHEPPATQEARIAEVFGTSDVSDLDQRTKNGDVNAAFKLVNILAVKGQFEKTIPTLHMLVDSGLPQADSALIATVVELGRSVDALRLARFGLTADGHIESHPATSVDDGR
jgi:hypothetical protein